MTSQTPDTGSAPESENQPPPSTGDCQGCRDGHTCRDCHPKLFDSLSCQAEGIKARSDYNEANKAALETARTQYGTTRTEYTTTRNKVSLDVEDLRHQAQLLIERIRCQIKQERVVRCVDRAYEEVCWELRGCPVPRGCCLDCDDDFDVDCDELDYAALQHRIVLYTARRDAAMTCFNQLVAEPAALQDRVDKARAEVVSITTDLGGEAANIELKSLYARALVAQRHLCEAEIWDGFPRAKNFLDCLCESLTCWTKASAAVSVLTGCLAVQDCHRRAHEARCLALTTQTAAEVLIRYEQCCGNEDCDCEHDDDDDRPPEHRHPHDCSCHHHHHQRNHHGCDCGDQPSDDSDDDRDRDRDRERDRDRDRDDDRDRDRDRDRDDDRDRDRYRDREPRR